MYKWKIGGQDVFGCHSFCYGCLNKSWRSPCYIYAHPFFLIFSLALGPQLYISWIVSCISLGQKVSSNQYWVEQPCHISQNFKKFWRNNIIKLISFSTWQLFLIQIRFLEKKLVVFCYKFHWNIVLWVISIKTRIFVILCDSFEKVRIYYILNHLYVKWHDQAAGPSKCVSDEWTCISDRQLPWTAIFTLRDLTVLGYQYI